MLRLMLSIGAAAALLCFQVRLSLAQITGDAPWCAVSDLGANEVVRECYYRTAEECAPHILAGNRGFCVQNPYWAPPPAPPPPPAAPPQR